MSVLKPRKRLVYFRVSEDEFLQFSAMCQSAGARSLSDLARSAMQRMLTAGTGESLIAERLKVFDELISLLNGKLRHMNELLEANGRGVSGKRDADTPSSETASLEQTHA